MSPFARAKHYLNYILTRNLVNQSIIDSVSIMASPEGRIQQCEQPDDADFEQAITPFARYLQQQGFADPVWIQSFTLTSGLPIHCGFWTRESDALKAAAYFANGQLGVEFVSTLANNGCLMTSNSELAGTLPLAPGRYLQIMLTGEDYGLLAQHHQQALERLTQRGQRIFHEVITHWPDFLENRLRQDAAHIQSIPNWKTQGARWYWLDRPKRINRPVL